MDMIVGNNDSSSLIKLERLSKVLFTPIIFFSFFSFLWFDPELLLPILDYIFIGYIFSYITCFFIFKISKGNFKYFPTIMWLCFSHPLLCGFILSHLFLCAFIVLILFSII